VSKRTNLRRNDKEQKNVNTTAFYLDQATNSLSNVRMNDYDRALAEGYLAQGTVLADLLLRAAHGVRGLFGNTGRLLSGFRLYPRV
jgi:hypothetical protein